MGIRPRRARALWRGLCCLPSQMALNCVAHCWTLDLQLPPPNNLNCLHAPLPQLSACKVEHRLPMPKSQAWPDARERTPDFFSFHHRSRAQPDAEQPRRTKTSPCILRLCMTSFTISWYIYFLFYLL